jgi:hypothetical protein
MTLHIADRANWRGRAQLRGVRRADGNVIYAGGPRVGVWTWDSSKNDKVRTLEQRVYQASLNAADAFAQKRDALIASRKYTPEGIRAELAAFATTLKTTIAEAEAQLAATARSLAEQRAQIKPAAKLPEGVTREDLREARALLRTLDQPKDRRKLVALLVREDADPALRAAVLEKSPEWTPTVTGPLRKHLEQESMRTQFGAQIDELNEIEAGPLAVSARAVQAVKEEIEAELSGRQPQREASPFELKAG